MGAAKFANLPEDIVRNVLEYVPLLDRVRYELVHSFWKDIISVMFESQKSLAITSGRVKSGWLPGHRSDKRCLDQKHTFYEINVVFGHSRDALLNLVKRCPNLKHLYVTTMASCGLELGTLLSQCPDLVHLIGEFEILDSHEMFYDDTYSTHQFLTNWIPNANLTCFGLNATADQIRMFFKKHDHLRLKFFDSDEPRIQKYQISLNSPVLQDVVKLSMYLERYMKCHLLKELKFFRLNLSSSLRAQIDPVNYSCISGLSYPWTRILVLSMLRIYT